MRALFFLLVLPLAAQVPSADELLANAVSLAKANQFDQAERVLLEGRKTFARDARFPIELAGIAWRRTEAGLAKSYLRQGLRLDPAEPYANEFLGTVYLLEGNVAAALKYLNRLRRPIIASVAIAPVPRLLPLLAERLPAVSTGQLLTTARFAETEQNFERLRIFSEPRFELNDSALVIQAQMIANPLSGTLGRVLPLLRGLPYQGVNLDWLNIHRRAINLTSLWRWDPDKRRIAATYRVPLNHHAYALWTDLRDEAWALPTRGERDIRSATLGAQVEFELGGGKVWTPGIVLSHHNIRGGAGDRLFANSTIWEVRNRFDLPRWRYAERRLQIDSSVTARTGRVFSRTPSRLVGGELDAQLRWLPQAKDDVYQVRGRLRAAALSGDLPVDALYATAMERDNDVWLRGHVGTAGGRKGNAPMGTRYAVAQSGVSRRVFRMPFIRVDAGPFLDIGNIGGTAGLGSRGFLYDTGIQADVSVLGGFKFSMVYGRDLRGGHHVFYTAISR